MFCYEDKMAFPIYVSDKRFKDSIDLLLLIDDDKSHYVYIKDFGRFMFHKTKNKNKKWFCRSCLQCFSSENVLINHKEGCQSINGKRSVDVGIIKFENYFKQLLVPFKIYADFECNLRNVEIYEGSYTKNVMNISPAVMLIKLFVLMIDLVSQLLFLQEHKYHKKTMKKHFHKNLFMTEEEEHSFQQSNNCWICKKLIHDDDENVRDHCHVTGKFRGSGHWDYNINFQLTKKVPVIFHNFKNMTVI